MIVLFDLMDTVVRDPVFDVFSAYFRSDRENAFRHVADPSGWVDFELGQVAESEFWSRAFPKESAKDLKKLQARLHSKYAYVSGMHELLCELRDDGVPMYAASNYPNWVNVIEEKLRLSDFMSLDFISYKIGVRKPDPSFYMSIVEQLRCAPSDCIFIDDRTVNCEAAAKFGLNALEFKNARALKFDLQDLGVLKKS